MGNMKRAWIQLPEALYDAAEERRKKLFLPSFTEYIRSLVRKDLASTAEQVDVKALARALAEED